MNKKKFANSSSLFWFGTLTHWAGSRGGGQYVSVLLLVRRASLGCNSRSSCAGFQESSQVRECRRRHCLASHHPDGKK